MLKLYVLIKLLTSSVPPVVAFAFSTIPVPIPKKTPPYILAKKTSFVKAGNLSRRSIANEYTNEPIIEFITTVFPNL